MRKTYKEKVEDAKNKGIFVPESLLTGKNIVGTYKFFYSKNDEDYCFYIGKSTNIAYRLLGSSNGHIHMYLRKNYSKIVPSKIKDYLEDGCTIKVEVREVDYHDTSFSKAAHRLALIELQEIVSYQEKGECLFQIPEGVGDNEKYFWEKNYKQQV